MRGNSCFLGTGEIEKLQHAVLRVLPDNHSLERRLYLKELQGVQLQYKHALW